MKFIDFYYNLGSKLTQEFRSDPLTTLLLISLQIKSLLKIVLLKTQTISQIVYWEIWGI